MLSRPEPRHAAAAEEEAMSCCCSGHRHRHPSAERDVGLSFRVALLEALAEASLAIRLSKGLEPLGAPQGARAPQRAPSEFRGAGLRIKRLPDRLWGRTAVRAESTFASFRPRLGDSLTRGAVKLYKVCRGGALVGCSPRPRP